MLVSEKYTFVTRECEWKYYSAFKYQMSREENLSKTKFQMS